MKLIILIVLFVIPSLNLCAQNHSKIYGKIIGAGTGTKVFLGNKPHAIGMGFTSKYYDSTITQNDSFAFEVKYKYPDFYSIQIAGSDNWRSFLIDAGPIYIETYADSIYRAKAITGSKNNDTFKKGMKDLYIPWEKKFNSYTDNLNKAQKDKDDVLQKEMNDSLEELKVSYYKSIKVFFLENVKETPLAAYLIFRFIPTSHLSFAEHKYYFDKLPSTIQNAPLLAEMKYYLYGYRKNVKVGKRIPNFKFFTLADDMVELNKIDAKYKLIDFWASWCGPCLEAIPTLDSVNKEYSKLGLKILSINVDNNIVPWKKNASKYNFDVIHLYQGSYSTSPMYKYFGITAIPRFILLDSENKIIEANLRLADLQKFIQ